MSPMEVPERPLPACLWKPTASPPGNSKIINSQHYLRLPGKEENLNANMGRKEVDWEEKEDRVSRSKVLAPSRLLSVPCGRGHGPTPSLFCLGGRAWNKMQDAQHLSKGGTQMVNKHRKPSTSLEMRKITN